MSTLSDRLGDPEYRNWVKAGICLGYFKDGVETFADQRSIRFHQHVLHQLGGNSSSQRVCPRASISFDKPLGKWKMSCCANCQQYVDEIENMRYPNFKFTQTNWNNSNIQLWPHEPWEMVKVYMNAGQKGTHKTPKDTDLSGILNFIDHCMIARGDISKTFNISKVRDARNTVMHSAIMKLSQHDFQSHTTAMIDLLEDPLFIFTIPQAQDAVKAIREVQNATFQITKEAEFTVLSEQTTQILHQYEALKDEFRRLETKWQEVETTSADDSQNLRSQLELETRERENDIKKLTAAFSGLKTLIQSDDNLSQKLDKDVKQLELIGRETHRELQNIKDRLRTLECEVKQLKTDVAQSKLDHAAKDTFAKDCEELKQNLLEEYKRIHFKVSLSPIYEGLNDDVLQVPVEELYTDVTIVRPDKKKEIALTSYKEMFHTKGTRNKTIFLKGEAGVGKSTWCMQLVNAWCKAHGKKIVYKRNSTEATATADKDMIEVMAQFDFLVFVQLRYVEGHTSIKDLIFASTLERLSNYEETFKKIIEKCSDKVLIILDGLDEYAASLDYKGLNQCTVISTTRPWKYDVVCSKNPKLKVDQLLKLKGLNSDGVAELSRKVLRILTRTLREDETDSEETDNFEDQASECVDHFQAVGLSESVKIPLILIFMVECWFENEKQLSPSLTCNLISLLRILLQRGKQKLSEADVKMYKSLKVNWSSEDGIPACFDEDSKIAKHYGLLLQLANLAYQGLSNSSKELSLVFREKQLNQYFKSGETDVCYKFGLLSRSKVSTSLTGPVKVTVSFYHKLVQEFFAALWIITKYDTFVAEKESLNSIDSILEMENVVVFLCGLQPSLGTQLTEHFVEVCNRDTAVVQHRKLGKNYRPLDSFTKLLRKCKEEVIHSPDPEEQLYLPDVFIIWGKIDDTLGTIIQQSTPYLQSLLLDNLEISCENWCQLLESINEAQLLQRMVIYLVTVTDIDGARKMRDVNVNLSEHKSLKRVTFLDGVQDIPDDSPWQPLFKGISGATSITEFRVSYIVPDCVNALLDAVPMLKNLEMFSVSNVPFEHRDLHIQNTKLKTLKMRNLEFMDGCVSLESVEKLEELHLDTVQMRTKSWEDFFRHLQTQPELRILDLSDIDIGEAIVQLNRSIRLQKLNIWRVKMSQKSWRQLFADLSSLSSLLALELTSIEAEDAVLMLDNNTDLERVSLNDLHMSEASWKHFYGSLPLFPQLRSLSLQRLNVGEVPFCLANNSKLQELNIWAVSSSQTSWIQLFNSLEKLPVLSRLKLMDLNIGTSRVKIGKSVKDLEVFKLVLTETSWQDSLKGIKSRFSLKANSIEKEEDTLIIPVTDREENGIFILKPLDGDNKLTEEIFIKHPVEIRLCRISFTL